MTADASPALGEFAARIAEFHLAPLWERTARLVPGSDCVSAVWRYAQMRPLLARAAELITQKQAERRVLVLENPAMRGSSFITNSLFAGLQIINPGEVAPSHRHTPSALRFVVEGEGAYTTVEGERLAMHPGDFIVTPSWAWHEHGNVGPGPVVWMDGLDTPFANLFGAHFRENAAPGSPPVVEAGGRTLIYPFRRSRDALRALARGGTEPLDTAHGHKLRYADPGSGGHPFRTMAAFMQLLPAGFRGRAYRATDGSVSNVAEGACRVELAGTVHELQTHDIFVVPPWETYRLEADDDCLLFSFSDRAAQEALGFWREDRS